MLDIDSGGFILLDMLVINLFVYVYTIFDERNFGRRIRKRRNGEGKKNNSQEKNQSTKQEKERDEGDCFDINANKMLFGVGRQ